MTNYCSGCPLENRITPCNPVGRLDSRFMAVTGLPRNQKLMSLDSSKFFGEAMAKQNFYRKDFVLVPYIRCEHDPDRFSSGDKKSIAQHCRGYLVDAIQQFKPEVVLPLGAEAAKMVKGRAVQITKNRGHLEYNEEHKTNVMPFLSPDLAVLYPQNAPIFDADCATLGRLYDHDYNIHDAIKAIPKGKYSYVNDLQFLVDQNPKVIAFDIETTGLRWYEDGEILTMQFCADNENSYVLGWDHPDQKKTLRAKARLREQIIKLLCDHRRKVLGQNCVTPNTEVLTPEGWIRVDAYDGQKIAQWSPTTEVIDFVNPLAYIEKEFNGEVCNWDMAMYSGSFTPEHRVYFSTTAHRHQYKVGRAGTFAKTNQNNKRFPLGGYISPSNSPIDISSTEARLVEALRADGNIQWSNGKADLRWKFKKARKVERLRALLAELNISYHLREKLDGVIVINIHRCELSQKLAMLFSQEKEYGPWVLRLPLEAREAILQEARFWDGHTNLQGSMGYIFSTANEKTAEWFQIMAHLSGWRFTYQKRENVRGWSVPNGALFTGTVQKKRDAKVGKPPLLVPYEGMVYCFNVPTGAFLIRHNGRISVTGNCKFDALWMAQVLDIKFKLAGDTLMAATLIDENTYTKGLDVLIKRYLPLYAGYSDWFDKNVDKSRLKEYPLDEKFLDYAAGDSFVTYHLHKVLLREISKNVKLRNYYFNVSIPALNMFCAVEGRGVLTNEQALIEFEKQMAESVEQRYFELLDKVPRTIRQKHLSGKTQGMHIDTGLKFTRAAFVSDILFTHEDGFRLTPMVFTDGTAKLEPQFQVPSVSTKDHLPYFFDDCPFTFELAEYIKEERLLNTDVRGFKKKYIRDDLVRCSYSLTTAATGRSSSREPNLQNRPKRGKAAEAYRSVYVAPENYYVLSCDLSQIELRAAANYANEKRMLEIYNSGGDIHLNTACRTMGLTHEQFSLLEEYEQDLARFKAKACIAKGSLVLTKDRGLVPIENVMNYDLVWDGIEWVAHDGVIYQGYREIIEYDGVKATPDHRVYTYYNDLAVSIGELASSVEKPPIVTSGNGEVPVRFVEINRESGLWNQKRKICRVLLQSVQSITECLSRKYTSWENNNLRLFKKSKIQERSESFNFRRKIRCLYSTMQDKKSQSKRKLWQSWYSSAFFFTRAFYYLVFGKFTASNLQKNAYRQNRQLWSLRTGEFTFSKPKSESFKQENQYKNSLQKYDGMYSSFMALNKVRVPVFQFFKKLYCEIGEKVRQWNGCTILREANNTFYSERSSGYGSSTDVLQESVACKKYAHVYDIVNAGPRHRFTVNNKLVANCNFGFLFGMGWRKFMAYAKTQYGIDFTEREAQKSRSDFFSEYPGLIEWHRKVREYAKQHKQVVSFSGRIRHLPMIDSNEEWVRREAERQAINAPVQEFACTLGLVAMSKLHEDIDDHYLSPRMFIHDDIKSYVRKENLLWAAQTVKRYMENVPVQELFGITLKCPIIADASFGINMGKEWKLKNLNINGSYDFSKFWNAETQTGILVPKQEVPENNGYRKESYYTKFTD